MAIELSVYEDKKKNLPGTKSLLFHFYLIIRTKK